MGHPVQPVPSLKTGAEATAAAAATQSGQEAVRQTAGGRSIHPVGLPGTQFNR